MTGSSSLFRWRAMPGIDYQAVRSSVAITDVLELLGFVAVERRGRQWRGPCPVQGSTSSKSRCFSVNRDKNAYPCFQCGSAGNQLDLWAAVSKEPLYEATLDLCRRLSRAVTWLGR
jgi:DNA primase